MAPASANPASTLETGLALLAEQYDHCGRCPLSRSRQRIVLGRGAHGGILLVTDRVAGIDERTGTLLSGPAGKLQEKILAAPKVEIPLDSVYVASTVACRAPADRIPRPSEALACRDRLANEIACAAPQIVVALGARAAAALGVEAEDVHGWLPWVSNEGPLLFVTLHPRDALWGPQSEIVRRKRILYDDWQAISARFREAPGSVGEFSAGEVAP